MTEYFQIDQSPSSDVFVLFNGTSIPGNNSPGYFEVFKTFGFTTDNFVKNANELLNELSIKIPNNYNTTIMADEFAICICCCLKIKENYPSVDIEKIIKKDLIRKNMQKYDYYHATTLALLTFHYLKNGSNVEILKEQKEKKSPDLKIDDFLCEVKTQEEPEWIQNELESSKKTTEHDLSKDICAHLGAFLATKGGGYKGIQQADIIFADLSYRSLGWLKKLKDKKAESFDLPELKKHRIIFFAKKILDFYGFYMDIDPNLWKIIRETKQKHSFERYP